MAIRSDHLVVSLISDQGHYTFLYGHTKHNREGGRNEQTRAWVSSKCKREVCDTFLQLAVHMHVFAQNFHKATRNADSFSCVSQPGLCRSTGLSSRLSDFCSSLFSALLLSPWLTCSVNWSLLLPSADCLLLVSFVSWLSLSSLGSSFPHPLPALREIFHLSPLCGFHVKADKGSLWLTPIHTEMDATHSVTLVITHNKFLDSCQFWYRIHKLISWVSWGYRIHQLHLCRGVRPSPMCVLDMTQNNLMVRLQ